MIGEGVGMQWWTLTRAEAGATGSTAELVIYDVIGTDFWGEGVAAKALLSGLSALDVDRIDVRLNSPGGSVWDGLAIYNALRDHRAFVTTHVDGLAASIASVIALAGDQVNMADNALMMIHNPFTLATGDADDMRSAAEMLDRIAENIVNIYAGRTGDADAARAAMDAETWYTASEALDAGLIDSVTTGLAVAASLQLDGFGFLHPPRQEGKPVTDTETPPVADAAAPTEPDTRYASAANLAALERQIQAVANLGARGERHPLAAYNSLAEYAQAVYSGAHVREYGAIPAFAAILDAITDDNPGVMPPSWATDVKGIIAQSRPAVELFGREDAGDAGLEFDWPYYDGDLSALVGEQTDEKSEVTSVLVKLKKGSATLRTFAAGVDVSYQLLMRSRPSYIDAMLKIWLSAYALATDNAHADALLAGATASVYDYDLSTDSTGAAFRAALFTASTEVQTATGKPATGVLVASNVFLKAGTWTGLYPSGYGVQNVIGTADAATLRVDINGLPVVHDPNLASGSIIVSNDVAAKWIEDGPHTATADVPTKLGRDYAIFGFGVTALYNAKGVVKVTNLP